jgi:hypothetical protein
MAAITIDTTIAGIHRFMYLTSLEMAEPKSFARSPEPVM